MNRNQMIAVAVAAIVVIVAAAVAITYIGGGSDDSSSGEDELLRVTDAMGNNIQLEERPDRIVSTTVTAAEMISDLGFRAQLVGATTDPGIYDVDSDVVGIDIEFDYPASIQSEIDAGTITNVGTFYGWTAESVATANPDLVIMEANQLEADASRMTQLQSLGVTVIVLWSDSGIDVIERNYEMLGGPTRSTQRSPPPTQGSPMPCPEARTLRSHTSATATAATTSMTTHPRCRSSATSDARFLSDPRPVSRRLPPRTSPRQT